MKCVGSVYWTAGDEGVEMWVGVCLWVVDLLMQV